MPHPHQDFELQNLSFGVDTEIIGLSYRSPQTGTSDSQLPTVIIDYKNQNLAVGLLDEQLYPRNTFIVYFSDGIIFEGSLDKHNKIERGKLLYENGAMVEGGLGGGIFWGEYEVCTEANDKTCTRPTTRGAYFEEGMVQEFYPRRNRHL